jgi:hypothetical protein
MIVMWHDLPLPQMGEWGTIGSCRYSSGDILETGKYLYVQDRCLIEREFLESYWETRSLKYKSMSNIRL